MRRKARTTKDRISKGPWHETERISKKRGVLQEIRTYSINVLFDHNSFPMTTRGVQRGFKNNTLILRSIQISKVVKVNLKPLVTLTQKESGTLSEGKDKSKKDKRITIKIDPSLWKAISAEIERHPEWGINSVSEFIRRAIDHEMIARKSNQDRKIIEICLDDRISQEGNRRKGSE